MIEHYDINPTPGKYSLEAMARALYYTSNSMAIVEAEAASCCCAGGSNAYISALCAQVCLC